MGLGRNNRTRQRMGKLLELTRDQQFAKQEWQAKRRPDWTDKMIVVSAVPDGVMTWGPAYSFDAIRNAFGIMEFKGKTRVSPSSPSWYRTVRTDTTDKLDRSKVAVDKRDRW